MKRLLSGLVQVLILWFTCLSSVASGPPQTANAQQESSDPKKTTRVTLGSATATPGSSAVVPIYFTPAEGMRVGLLKLAITFVSRNLKFSSLEAGPAAELGKAELRSDLKESKNEQGLETTALTMVASSPSSSPSPEGIRAGLLAYLNFRLNEGARPASISVRVSGEAAELGSNRPVQNLRTFDAQVDVLAPGSEPFLVCFFFTH